MILIERQIMVLLEGLTLYHWSYFLFLNISTLVNHASLTSGCLRGIITRQTKQIIYTPPTFFGLLAKFPVPKPPYNMAKVDASFQDDSGFKSLALQIESSILISRLTPKCT